MRNLMSMQFTIAKNNDHEDEEIKQNQFKQKRKS